MGNMEIVRNSIAEDYRLISMVIILIVLDIPIILHIQHIDAAYNMSYTFNDSKVIRQMCLDAIALSKIKALTFKCFQLGYLSPRRLLYNQTRGCVADWFRNEPWTLMIQGV